MLLVGTTVVVRDGSEGQQRDPCSLHGACRSDVVDYQPERDKLGSIELIGVGALF